MGNHVLVSVVVPVFNSAPYITQTLRSVQAQTCDDFDVIVIDDGSTDSSAEMVAELAAHDERFSLHRLANAGVCTARNRGLERARGKFVAFLDHDDIWYPPKLERQVAVLTERPDVAVVGCLMRYISASGRQLGTNTHMTDPIDQRAVRAGRITPFNVSAALFRTADVRRVGGFVDLFGDGWVAEDIHLYARMAEHGEVLRIREVLGAYRVHRAALSVEKALLTAPAVEYGCRALADPSFTKRVPWEEFRAAYRPSRKERRNRLAQIRYRNGAIALLEHQWGAAASDLGRAFALAPTAMTLRAWRQLRPPL